MNDYHQAKTSTKPNEDQMHTTADNKTVSDLEGGRSNSQPSTESDQQSNKEYLYKLQSNLKDVIMNIISEIHLVKTMFQVEQIKCK